MQFNMYVDNNFCVLKDLKLVEKKFVQAKRWENFDNVLFLMILFILVFSTEVSAVSNLMQT